MLEKVISGGQNGADVAGWIAAKKVGLETGGTMPRAFVTLDGPKPEYEKLYNAQQHDYSYKYAVRTSRNVAQADATLRFASNFGSFGEKCTLRAIKQHKKPYMDIQLNDDGIMTPNADSVVTWLKKFDIKVLNVAGNSENSSPGITGEVVEYLIQVFEKLGFDKN